MGGPGPGGDRRSAIPGRRCHRSRESQLLDIVMTIYSVTSAAARGSPSSAYNFEDCPWTRSPSCSSSGSASSSGQASEATESVRAYWFMSRACRKPIRQVQRRDVRVDRAGRRSTPTCPGHPCRVGCYLLGVRSSLRCDQTIWRRTDLELRCKPSCRSPNST